METNKEKVERLEYLIRKAKNMYLQKFRFCGELITFDQANKEMKRLKNAL